MTVGTHDLPDGSPLARDFALRAVRLSPGYARANNSAAWALATAPDLHDSERAAALRYARRAIAFDAGDNAHHYDTLAATYARLQDYDTAIAVELRALDSVPKDAEERAGFVERLRLYRARTPYQPWLRHEAP